MLDEAGAEVRRQAAICNSCRYCEGYCAVFPVLHSAPILTDGAVVQLANLCHNCRGCYYACQFTEPHEFALNLPKALAELRQESWQAFAYPALLGSVFHRNGLAIAAVATVGFALMLWAARSFVAGDGASGFYAVLSHSLMVLIFAPAFVLPLAALMVSLRRYWHHVGGGRVTWADLRDAGASVARMRNLSGGHGDGCNFEDVDRFSHARRHTHQAVMYGFLLCFAATCAGTVLHYGFDRPAPYGVWSLPKLLGLSGGLLMVAGCLGLLMLKRKSDPNLGEIRVWGGEVGFVVLLLVVALSGLLLYGLGQTAVMPFLLYLHLGSVLALFLLTPYSKMAHGFYRCAALIKDAQIRRVAER